MSDLLKGDDVYRRLMDVALMLQEVEHMGPLHQFLTSVAPGNPALVRLDGEVEAFQARLEGLVRAAKGR